jgi:hypothetical protein
MSKLKLLSAALVATAMFAAPAVARTSHVTSQHGAENADTARHIDGRVSISAPRVVAPAAAENCDEGDNERIC